MLNLTSLLIDRMAGIERNLLKELVDFLKVFKDASDELEASKTVTLHMVVPWFYRLQGHCHIDNSKDSEPMTKIKARAALFIESKFKIDSLHLLATVLNPKMKGLKMLSDSQRQTVYTDLRSRVESLDLSGMHNRYYIQLHLSRRHRKEK
jgi:hypothetical protein